MYTCDDGGGIKLKLFTNFTDIKIRKEMQTTTYRVCNKFWPPDERTNRILNRISSEWLKLTSFQIAST